jgi:DNA-binding response OmpR family regulator
MDTRSNRKPKAERKTQIDGLRILVAEDDKILRQLLQEALETGGAEVVVTASGEHAMDAFFRARALDDAFDAALIDVRLGGLGGVETLTRLRAADAVVRLIAISGTYVDAPTSRMFSDRHIDFLRKPFDLAEVIHRLANEEGDAGAVD